MRKPGIARALSWSLLLCVLFVTGGCAGSSDSSNEVNSPSGAPAVAPSGPATLIVKEGFENGSFDPFWNDPYVNPVHYLPNSSASPFVSSPVRSGRFAAHYFLIEGTSEQTPFQVSQIEFSAEEFYVEWYEYLANDYPTPLGQKMCRFIGPNFLEVDIINLENNQNLQLFWYHDGREGFLNTARGVPLERWNKFGFWVKLNSLGQADGFVRLYVDDQLIGSLEGQEIRNRPDTFETMWIGGNYTNQAPLGSSGSRFIDDISWYTTKP